jgi:L-amino acid N-acyltransferase YncA
MRPDLTGMMTAPPTIEAPRAEHWPHVAAIYEAGIATGNATFETVVPTWEEWDRLHRSDLRFVATVGH